MNAIKASAILVALPALVLAAIFRSLVDHREDFRRTLEKV